MVRFGLNIASLILNCSAYFLIKSPSIFWGIIMMIIAAQLINEYKINE
jgi:hypothetical protein